MVWVTSKLVWPSTVAAAVMPLPKVVLVVEFGIAIEVNSVEPALLKVLPAAMFMSPLKLLVPATVKLPPRVVAPVPTLKVLVPVMLVSPLRLTTPVPVPKVPVPLKPKLPPVWV